MTASPCAVEQRLIHAYQDQLRHYDRALAIVDQQAAAPAKWVHELHTALHDLATLDAALGDDKSAWRSSGKSPGTELSALLDRLADRIGTLAERIDRHLADLQAGRQQLLPEIDAFIKKRRMLQAYGSSLSRP